MNRAVTEPFDATTMPLTGVRLIEASAGTGKTFSLAGLYLRLIIEQRLDVREILVMTFTRAATQELRERLRARLALAARVAAEPANGDRPDTAARWIEHVIAQAGEDRPSIADRLRKAATRIDQATIATIHGFAQGAAAENAFDSGLPFDRGEAADDRELAREASADFWRSRVFGASTRQARAFLGLWPDPDALRRDLAPLLLKPHARRIRPRAGELQRLAADARNHWSTEREDLRAMLIEAEAQNACYANKSALRNALEGEGVDGLLDAVDAGLAGTLDGFATAPAVLARLATGDAVAGEVKKPARQWFRPQDLAATTALARLAVDGRLAALDHAADEVHGRMQTRKRERRLFSFADMIEGLQQALAEPEQGPRLAAALRRTWPWALVDESQDTDPLQYDILRRIYASAEHAGGLILIGDPKQAIYGFRGGDVHAWLAAADDAAGRYGMAVNHRSTPAVVDGLNALFSAGGEQAFLLDGIDFQRVTAQRPAGDRRLLLDDAEVPGVTAWTLDAAETTAKGELQPRLRDATVGRIRTLLDRALMTPAGEDGRRLRATDIAVLVNSNREAAEMQEALRKAEVPAVCIQQDSVFTREAATDVLALLQAAAAPLAADYLRTALVSPLFGLRLGDLVELDHDEQRWSAWTDHFQRLHADWSGIGVQAMLEPVLQSAAARVAARSDGERRLTDYLHVAERLQAAEHEVFGLDGLIAWLAQAIREADDGEAGDADRVRLADDAELVTVTTVHKAKGLQYPVVFVPYSPWLGTGGPTPGEPPLEFHDEAGRAVIDLGSAQAAEHRPAAVRERRAEQIRSLYVALTRAEQACCFVHCAANGAGDGPLAWLLHQADGAEAGTWWGRSKCPDWLDADTAAARLQAVARKSNGGLCVESLPEPAGTGGSAVVNAGESIGPARTDLPARRRPWGIFSFSGLAGRMSAHEEPAAGKDDPATLTRPDHADDAGDIPLSPRGPGFGQAFHELLETVDFAAWPPPQTPAGPEHEARVATALRRHGVAATAGADGNVARTCALLATTLHSPLPEIGPLAAIPPARRVSEMEFFLRLGGVDAEALLERIAAAGYTGAGGQQAPLLLRGLMHGYIDLVVEHAGAYWLLDYKTNALGSNRRDYAPDALATAVAEHHYDLQYLIYSVALHRHLRRHLAAYDPGRHLGGVLYLFVRGLTPGAADSGVFHDRPDPELVTTLDDWLDGSGEAA